MTVIEDPYADLRVLLHWHGRPMRRALSRRQVMIGPFCTDMRNGDDIVSLQTPLGLYDVKSVVDRLPVHQRPDVFVAMIDATKAAVPRNLAALDCPSIMVIGDTHHLEAPIRFAISAMLAEPYALVVGNHLAQHLHFMSPVARSRIVWIPGLWVEQYDLPFREDRDPTAVFIGQVGEFHPYRSAVIEAVRRTGLPLETGRLPPEEAARRHGSAALTLNVSLNGDMNMRVFEALGHGGCLLTDRLAPESGLYRLFRDGEDLLSYDGHDDLAAKIRHYLGRPDEALAIARRGLQVYEREHTPDRKRRQLFSGLLNDGNYPPPPWSDTRSGDGTNLMPRLLVYEHVQERHRTATSLQAMATAGVDARIRSDLGDLPRLSVRGPDASDQVDLLLTTAAEAEDAAFAATVARVKPGEIVVTDAGAVTPPPGYAAVPGELTVWKSA